MLANSDVATTYEEDELVDFARHHSVFFYGFTGVLGNEDYEKWVVKPERVDVLWPKIYEYLEMWRDAKKGDVDAVGMVMVKDLEAAGQYAPTWPEEVPF